MKGSNEMLLNEATMIEAVSYWLVNQVFHPSHVNQDVASVKQSGDGTFVIGLREKE
jgi:hypothetical protein